MKQNNRKWLTLVDSFGVLLGEFNMNSPRVRTYVITVLLPSLIRREIEVSLVYFDSPQYSYPYHYSFAGDIFDSIHISKELSSARVMRKLDGLTLLDPADCI